MWVQTVIGLQHLILKENKNKKVNLELSLGNHFISLFSKDPESESFQYSRKDFEKRIKTNALTSTLNSFLKENNINYENVENIKLYQENDLFTLVPEELFDEKEKKTYLKYITKVKKTDFISNDNIEELKIKNVYIPYVNINNFLVDIFKNIDYYHFNSILIKKVFHIKNDKSFFAYVDNNKLKIIIFNKDELIFFNSYEIESETDIIYFLLLSIKEKGLEIKETQINFILDKKNDLLLEIADKFFDNFEIINDKKIDFIYSEWELLEGTVVELGLTFPKI